MFPAVGLLFLGLALAEAKGTYYAMLPIRSRLEERQSCNVNIKEETGVIRSPGFPSRYPRYSSCSYVIEKYSSDVCEIKLTFDFFQVAETPGCKHDYLELLDNRGWSYRICGTLQPGSKKFVFFSNKSSTMTLKFKSGAHSDRGFSMTVKQLRHSCFVARNNFTTAKLTSCDQEIHGRVGRITSPGFPNAYGPGEACTYTIHRSEARACRVELDFIRFDLEHSPGCTKDFLLFPDDSRACGSIGSVRRSFSFPRDTQTMTLMFSSSGKGKGFDILVRQLPGPCMQDILQPESHQCDQELRSETGIFTSPGYPRSYGPNFYCAYEVFRPDPTVCRLQLDFEVFDVGRHNPASCTTGAFLELPGKMRMCKPFTGTRIIEVSEFQDPVVFHFASDGHSSGRGFKIHVKQLPNTCKKQEPEPPTLPEVMTRCYQEVSTEIGFFTAPRHVSRIEDYFCDFLIRKFHPSVCTVMLQVALRENQIVPCSTNYIELPNGHRLCLAPSPPKYLMFPQTTDKLLLFYHGQDDVQFTLYVEQITDSCGGKIGSAYLPPTPPSRWSWKIYPR